MFIFANTQAGIDFFDVNAEAVGYQATDTFPAGLVAWEAKAKEIVGQHITSFPNTPLLISGARPYGGPGRLFAK